MKARIQYFILLSCLVVVLPLNAEPAYSQSLTSITENDVLAIINAVDKAARKRNIAGMIAPWADDIKIKMTVVNKGSERELVTYLTKEEFAFNVRQIMRHTISYQFERRNTRIKIYDDTTAMVTSELYETFKFRQGTLRASSSDVLYVSLRNGKLVITSNEMRIRFY